MTSDYPSDIPGECEIRQGKSIQIRIQNVAKLNKKYYFAHCNLIYFNSGLFA